MKYKKQRGFTLIELAFALCGLFCVGGAGLALYVAWHFVSKFW